MKNKIVTLQNGLVCCVLEELEYKERNFVYAIEVNGEEIGTQIYILEVINESGKKFLKEIGDEELITEISNLFLLKIKSN